MGSLTKNRVFGAGLMVLGIGMAVYGVQCIVKK